VSSDTPADLRYTDQHEWLRPGDSTVRMGITDFAQQQLGDVVYVDLPAPGADVDRGQPVGEVESTKSVTDLYAPVSGVVRERNEALEERPELVNEDPYGEGWMIEIELRDPDEVTSLLDAEHYRGHIDE
jgi:glycine cleavage system H protein